MPSVRWKIYQSRNLPCKRQPLETGFSSDYIYKLYSLAARIRGKDIHIYVDTDLMALWVFELSISRVEAEAQTQGADSAEWVENGQIERGSHSHSNSIRAILI